MAAELRQRLVTRLLGWYREDADAGIHGTIDWLLRHSKEGKNDRPLDWGSGKGAATDRRGARDPLRADRAATTAGQIGAVAGGGLPQPVDWTVEPARPGRGWYVNGQGQTLTVLEGTKPFLMGSPDNEAGREVDEKQH